MILVCSMSEKEGIRKSLKAILKLLNPVEVNKKSSIIVEKLLNSKHYKTSKDIFSYVPNGEWEVDIKPLLTEAFIEGKKVWVPRVEKDGLIWHCVDEQLFYKLEKNKWNILEPLPTWEPQLEEAFSGSLCVVPGIAFDRFGNRIGRGKGYFDRFLKRSKCYTIGVCFTFQLIQRCPRSAWDVKVDKVITEDYEFTI